jgi:hypothetical protein
LATDVPPGREGWSAKPSIRPIEGPAPSFITGAEHGPSLRRLGGIGHNGFGKFADGAAVEI